MRNPDPVPSVPEAEATGEIAAIYDDIRATTGVPLVNLIWRHLATDRAALAWAWGAVRPLYADGTIAAEAEAFAETMLLPELPELPASVLRAAGLDSAAERGISLVLASYDRGNTMNLLGLTTLLHGIDRRPPAPGERRTGGGGGLDAVLPKLLAAEEMTIAAADLVMRLNALGERGGGRIVASLYRHLAHWPGFLALAWVLLAPLDADGRLGHAIAHNLDSARARAAVLAGGLGTVPTPPPATAAFVRGALQEFTGNAIARMATIGRLLVRVMPA